MTQKLPWFRMYTEFATDPDVQCLAFEDQRHYVILLCLKGSGVLDKDYPSAEHRERVIRRGLGLDALTAGEVRRRLRETGLIDEEWQPKGWDKRQFQSDQDRTAAERQRRRRERIKGERHADVTRDVTRESRPPDTDTDTEPENTPPTPPKGAARRFEEFWQAFPRKVGKAAAKRVWSRKRLDDKADTIIEHLAERVRSDAQWLEASRLIPHPQTWLNREGWDDDYERGNRATSSYNDRLRQSLAEAEAQEAGRG